MALVIDPPPSRTDGRLAELAGGRRSGVPARGDATITIGLINNMPDSALEGTETQFTSLLRSVPGAGTVRLRVAALPEVPRGPEAAARIARQYWHIDDLLAAPLDALIVTGTEPRAQSLRTEPYWGRLVEVMAYAQAHTVSTIWSCLAAHAAVLELDGIERQRLPEKRCGVFDHRLLSGHPLTANLGQSQPVPHSRWNDLPIEQLKAAGYAVLSESPETGADAFVRHDRSLFVFLQGHPEYEERTLLKEFQRDVVRFVTGQQPTYPSVPAGYFGPAAMELLTAFRRDLQAGRLADPLAAFPFTAVAATLSNSWREPASRFYGNWLAYIAEQRSGGVSPVASRYDCAGQEGSA